MTHICMPVGVRCIRVYGYTTNTYLYVRIDLYVPLFPHGQIDIKINTKYKDSKISHPLGYVFAYSTCLDEDLHGFACGYT